MTAPRYRPSRFLEALSADLHERLDTVECEAGVLRAALACLEGPAQSSGAINGRGLSTPDAVRRRLLRALEKNPGTRASLLALTKKRPADDIRRILEQLGESGLVEPDGLGWRLASSVEANPH